MFSNATVSSRSSSNKSVNSFGRNSSMPSLRMRNPLSPKTSYNPLFRHSDALTSFDASHFIFQENKRTRREKKHAILRRYNSHESYADVKIDYNDSTPESTKSRLTSSSGSNSTDERKPHAYSARDFLERYSLPRVVRVEDGEPLLLYKCFDSFTKVQAKAIVGKKGKEKVDENVLHFPEGYCGWFSLTNDKGDKCAILHTTVLQLVREQVCSFMSMQPITAYATQSTDLSDSSGKTQYFKTQVRGGQLFQLRAVFQHKERAEGGRNSTRSSRISRSARDKDLANRYAQLVSQTNQEYYVPLTTKGEFYEIHSSIKARLCFPGMLDKTGPLALDKDCLYKITHLLRRVSLPVKVKLLAGPLPPGLPKDFTDTFILEKKFQEPLLVTCTLPAPNQTSQHKISCLNLNSKIKIAKCTLGFDSENRLFKSQRLQAALTFCHRNVELWYREVRLAPNLENELPRRLDDVCKDCKKLNSECKGSCRKVSQEQEAQYNESKQIITKEVLEKFPKAKKWYKHFKLLGSNDGEKFNELRDPMDGMEKGKSIERYKDMSKLIEQKFGKRSYNPVKKSASFMFSTKRIDLEESHPRGNNPALLKCQSLDTQLYTVNEYNSKSNVSDNLSYDFQMCILENEGGLLDKKTSKHLSGDLDKIQPAIINSGKLRKSKPDLIPTLPKEENTDHSYFTERLCSEFHVKTKIQKRPFAKNDLRLSGKQKSSANLSVFNPECKTASNVKSVVVQVHEVKPSRQPKSLEVEVPYCKVADEVGGATRKVPDENIYAEICEDNCACDSKICTCKRTKNNQYCYVKLGSNGDSVTQSDSDEAIYNTLR